MTEMSVFKSYTDAESDDAFGADSIFAGLSVSSTIPASIRSNVPKADNALIALSLPSAPTYQPNSAHPSAPSLQRISTDQHAQHAIFVHQQEQLNQSTTSAPALSLPKKKGSLQSLYATEIITAEHAPSLHIPNSSYPDVPTISRMLDRKNNQSLSNREYAHEETESLLSASTAPANNNQTIYDGSVNMSTTLVNELLQENSRLTEEVEQLRRLVNQRVSIRC